MTDVIDKLNWRYATKKYDTSKKLDDATLERILEAVRLAPTSSGLQPFEVFVVSNAELRAKIRAVGWDQSQITDASRLLVFAAWDDITEERINMMFKLATDERGEVNEGWESYRKVLIGIAAERGQQANFDAAARQAYIALGVALVAAAFEGVDATPMEGFDPPTVDDILSLRERHLRSVFILPLGYRQADGDWLVNLKKVRRSRENLVTEIA
jgi:nitroreductase/dihydropteridine reductase